MRPSYPFGLWRARRTTSEMPAAGNETELRAVGVTYFDVVAFEHVLSFKEPLA